MALRGMNQTRVGPPTNRPRRPLPKSDLGTVVAHWGAVGTLVVSLLTGLRIAADALDSRLAAAVSHWLPAGEIWSIHIPAGLPLPAHARAYAPHLIPSGVS